MQQKLRDKFKQPIELAAAQDDPEWVQMLIDKGADVNCISSDFKTPLDVISDILQKDKPKDKKEPQVNKKQEEMEKKLSKLDKNSWQYDELKVNVKVFNT